MTLNVPAILPGNETSAHMAGGGESEEGDYWPGYVDALTAMVKVLSFVMMLLAVAVFVLSQNVSKAAVEAIAKAANVDVPPDADVAELTRKVVEAVEQRQAALPPPPSTTPAEQSAAPSEAKLSERSGASRVVNNDHKIEISPDAKRLSVPFEARGFKVDGTNKQNITAFATENKLSESQAKIIVRSYALNTEGALSEARRIAYYRGMMIRKELVDRKIRPEDIRINVYDTGDKTEGSTVDIFTDIKPN